MCLITLAWQAHPRHRLVLAANRDEWRDRPAAAVHRWPEAPHVIAGRDLRAGGAWLGVTHHGRFAAVTNFRSPADSCAAPRSRGDLVSAFLLGTEDPLAYLEGVASRAQDYRGFNLLVGDTRTLAYFSNHDRQVRMLEPGVHALSNHLLNTPWPKVRRARSSMAKSLDADDAALFALLADASVPADADLPDTGVGLARERALASVLITGERYGTRASTVLRLGVDGGRIEERSLDALGRVVSAVSFDLPGA